MSRSCRNRKDTISIVYETSPRTYTARHLLQYLALGLALVATLAVFSRALSEIFDVWNLQPEYSYGIIVPALSGLLIWRQRDKLLGLPMQGSWIGLGIVVLGIALRAIGTLSTAITVERYAFLVVTYGLVLSLVGTTIFRRLWAPLALLIFMIPLPEYLTGALTLDLQLISSRLGVAVIRAAGISVFLEGNVVDLGTMQLQVAEACSGLRYLFPLMTLSFLIAYLFNGPLWKRTLIFLVSIPITILMNSLRIGVIGITVEYWGPRMAEGVLHDFEGWLVFMVSTALVVLTAFLLSRIGASRTRWSEAFQVLLPVRNVKAGTEGAAVRSLRLPRSFFVATAIVTAGAIAGFTLKPQTEMTPAREDFTAFPLQMAGWTGHRSVLDSIYLDTLQLDDYILADYYDAGGTSINFYSAYYATQHGTRRAHSPRNCIPGGGWTISHMERRLVPIGINGAQIPVNRAVIALGEQRQIVYYWYQERGRLMTNDNVVKWYLFWDGLTRQRTDGALVRLVAALPANKPEDEVDVQLQRFARVAVPKLSSFVAD
jgi:exosortase D (VPLPA-CTERM-specific)